MLFLTSGHSSSDIPFSFYRVFGTAFFKITFVLGLIFRCFRKLWLTKQPFSVEIEPVVHWFERILFLQQELLVSHPYHESVITFIGALRTAEFRHVANFLIATKLPKNYDAVIEAWRRQLADNGLDDAPFGVIPALEEQKREAAIKLGAYQDTIDRLSKRWDEFDDVSIGTLNWLTRTGRKHVWCLAEMSEEEILRFVRTQKELGVIRRIIEGLGFHFGMDIKEFIADLPRR